MGNNLKEILSGKVVLISISKLWFNKMYSKPNKFIHIGNLANYKELAEESTYALFQAQLAYEDSEYLLYFKNISRKKYTIMDNGMLEIIVGNEERQINNNDYIDLAMEISVREVICPDDPLDPHGSKMKTIEFLKLIRRKGVENYFNLMIVPHGYSEKEWLYNAEELLKIIGMGTVGIPRLLKQRIAKNKVDFRTKLATKIKNKFKGINVHLLGAGEDFIREIKKIQNCFAVSSVDSTFIQRYCEIQQNPEKNYIGPVKLNSKTRAHNFTERKEYLLREYF